MTHEPRTSQAKSHRELTKPWYGTAQWKRRRRDQLQSEPLCWMCKRDGLIVPATVADHDPGHFGDPDVFWNGRLRSLCAPCHNRDAQRRDKGGTPRQRFALDGWPIESEPNNGE